MWFYTVEDFRAIKFVYLRASRRLSCNSDGEFGWWVVMVPVAFVRSSHISRAGALLFSDSALYVCNKRKPLDTCDRVHNKAAQIAI